jgi:hypothetical protein
MPRPMTLPRWRRTHVPNRQSWGRAGAILVSAALGAVGARAHALPLLIEVAAVVSGCFLMIFGKRDTTITEAGDSADSPLKFTDAELRELAWLCRSQTDLQLSTSGQYYGHIYASF